MMQLPTILNLYYIKENLIELWLPTDREVKLLELK